jgi:peptide/nickel transport system substrate-binding protein
LNRLDDHRTAGALQRKGQACALAGREIPTVGNGGVSEDLTSITWKITPGLLWSDGTPLTSADVLFTYEYCTHPEGGCAQATKFEGVESVETPDDLTVVVTFSSPTPNPYGPFVGGESPIIQAAQFADCMGAKAPECTDAELRPDRHRPLRGHRFPPNDVIQMAANRTTATRPSRPSPRSPSRAAATPRRRAARSWRPASSTMPGTCSWPPT